MQHEYTRPHLFFSLDDDDEDSHGLVYTAQSCAEHTVLPADPLARPRTQGAERTSIFREQGRSPNKKIGGPHKIVGLGRHNVVAMQPASRKSCWMRSGWCCKVPSSRLGVRS